MSRRSRPTAGSATHVASSVDPQRHRPRRRKRSALRSVRTTSMCRRRSRLCHRHWHLHLLRLRI
eukprot:1213701-Lingulodinium_polyedra.AAC.1